MSTSPIHPGSGPVAPLDTGRATPAARTSADAVSPTPKVAEATDAAATQDKPLRFPWLSRLTFALSRAEDAKRQAFKEASGFKGEQLDASA